MSGHWSLRRDDHVLLNLNLWRTQALLFLYSICFVIVLRRTIIIFHVLKWRDRRCVKAFLKLKNNVGQDCSMYVSPRSKTAVCLSSVNNLNDWCHSYKTHCISSVSYCTVCHGFCLISVLNLLLSFMFRVNEWCVVTTIILLPDTKIS